MIWTLDAVLKGKFAELRFGLDNIVVLNDIYLYHVPADMKQTDQLLQSGFTFSESL